MTKILFICHGNICRSPMAEYVMKEMVRGAGMAGGFEIDSAAVSREEIGNSVYPPARRMLARHGIPCGDHRARQVTRADYDEFDLLIGMDAHNMTVLRRLLGGDPQGKCRLLLEYAGSGRDISDPWYSGDFEAAYADIDRGCRALFTELTK